jgi:hypothetical protein
VILRVRLSQTARVAAIGIAVGLLAIAALFLAPRLLAPARVAAPPPPPAVAARKIKAALFYLSAEGTRLAPVDRLVAFGEGPVEQAKRIIEAQVAAPPPDARSAIPPGTSLRALYVLKDGQAFVDLSREVSSAHPGGTMNEILTVYTIVQALTTNLPAVTSVHLLVDGKEVETLAGHVDLRRALRPNTNWVIHDPR